MPINSAIPNELRKKNGGSDSRRTLRKNVSWSKWQAMDTKCRIFLAQGCSQAKETNRFSNLERIAQERATRRQQLWHASTARVDGVGKERWRRWPFHTRAIRKLKEGWGMADQPEATKALLLSRSPDRPQGSYQPHIWPTQLWPIGVGSVLLQQKSVVINPIGVTWSILGWVGWR